MLKVLSTELQAHMAFIHSSICWLTNWETHSWTPPIMGQADQPINYEVLHNQLSLSNPIFLSTL